MTAGWHCRPACRDRQLSPSALAPGLFPMEWRHVINALRPQFRVLAVDHLGFGLSERPKGVAYTPEARDPALRPQIN